MISQQGQDPGSQTRDPMLFLSPRFSQNRVPTEEPPAWRIAMSWLDVVCKQLTALARLQIRKPKLKCKTLQTFQRGQRQYGQEGSPPHSATSAPGMTVAPPWVTARNCPGFIPLTSYRARDPAGVTTAVHSTLLVLAVICIYDYSTLKSNSAWQDKLPVVRAQKNCTIIKASGKRKEIYVTTNFSLKFISNLVIFRRLGGKNEKLKDIEMMAPNEFRQIHTKANSTLSKHFLS